MANHQGGQTITGLKAILLLKIMSVYQLDYYYITTTYEERER